nr:beta-glucosidase-related glycosidase [Lachnospiraceae bacterium]
MKLEDYENRHIAQLRKRAGECTLFLKRDGAFPVKEPGTLALYGNGARNTIKGGTGSGDVDSRFFVNFEDGLSDAGFKVLTKEWLDGYDEIVKAGHKSYIREAKAAARK